MDWNHGKHSNIKDKCGNTYIHIKHTSSLRGSSRKTRSAHHASLYRLRNPRSALGARGGEAPRARAPLQATATPNLPISIVDFRGFDSSVILILRGGITRSIGDFPESLTQAMLVGCNVSREIGRTETKRCLAKGLFGADLERGNRRMTFQAPREPFI